MSNSDSGIKVKTSIDPFASQSYALTIKRPGLFGLGVLLWVVIAAAYGAMLWHTTSGVEFVHELCDVALKSAAAIVAILGLYLNYAVQLEAQSARRKAEEKAEIDRVAALDAKRAETYTVRLQRTFLHIYWLDDHTRCTARHRIFTETERAMFEAKEHGLRFDWFVNQTAKDPQFPFETALMTTLGNFEDTALFIRFGHLDEALIKESYSLVVARLVKCALPYIEHKQRHANPDAYTELLKLHDSWRANRSHAPAAAAA